MKKGNGELLFNRYHVSVWEDEKALETGAQHCEHSQCHLIIHRKWLKWLILCYVYFTTVKINCITRKKRKRGKIMWRSQRTRFGQFAMPGWGIPIWNANSGPFPLHLPKFRSSFKEGPNVTPFHSPGLKVQEH